MLGLVIQILSPKKVVIQYPASAEGGSVESLSSITPTSTDPPNPFATATATLTPISIPDRTETITVREPEKVVATEIAIPTSVSDEHLVIEKIGVDSETTHREIAKNGVMEDPAVPLEVSSYELTDYPELENQRLFAGHYDYAGFGPAIFHRLGELKRGDLIKLAEPEGEKHFIVISNEVFPITFNVYQILNRSTWLETINLITCDGTFVANNYTERRFIQAVRVD
ncbi:MAG TPA: class F sortase [Candidatus Saccharimonadales bacterium]|nr:class F sortase [Candidatus Saccharimonadales bacterium]